VVKDWLEQRDEDWRLAAIRAAVGGPRDTVSKVESMRGGSWMVWVLLVGAIAAEVVATSFLKLSEGLTKLVPSIVLLVCYLASFLLLSQALKQLQVSVAYAIWSGVGTAAITVIGMLVLGFR
jgi:small multidrug resistance pump